MEIETRESKIAAALAVLREQGDDAASWIDKIVADANAMTECDPVVAYVRDQVGQALVALRKSKIEAAKPPSNGINESLSLLDYRCWDSMERESVLAWAKAWAPGETLQTIEWFYLETVEGSERRATS